MRTPHLPPNRSTFASAFALLAAVTVGACDALTGPGERLRTYEVAESEAACVDVGARECLRVRTPPDTAWTLFYSAIDGFAYEPGYRWVIRVAERDVPDPPADGSSISYRLVRVESKTRVTP